MVDFHAALRDGSAPSLAFRSAIRSASSKALVPTTGVDSAFTALECSSRAAHLGGVLASARCVCVLMAAVALTDGVPGTAESWADLLSGCRRHGTVGDGNRMVRLQWSPTRGLDGMPAAP